MDTMDAMDAMAPAEDQESNHRVFLVIVLVLVVVLGSIVPRDIPKTATNARIDET